MPRKYLPIYLTRFGFSLIVSLWDTTGLVNLALLHPAIAQIPTKEIQHPPGALCNQAFWLGIEPTKIRGGSRKVISPWDE
jgi:hypothetical protein